jgi:uncharacterized protein (TIGR01777 family)
MKVIIAGGSGLLGRALTEKLAATGYHVVVLSRERSGASTLANVRHVEWTPDGSAGGWAAEIEGANAVVNLAGAGLADERWSDERKEELRSSRVLPTRSLVAAIRQARERPGVLIQASGVGFYGAEAGDREVDESFPPGDDFLGQLCVAWEAEAHPVTALGCRLVLCRSGVVLTQEGGILGRLRLPFRLLAGGPVASGTQYLSWIHVDDWLALVMWALTTAGVSGAVNATSPIPVTNAEFSRAFARALNRPSWLRVPAIALRVVYGEMADAMLIRGQRALPRRAQELGFRFKYPAIEEAMAATAGRKPLTGATGR